MTTKPAQSQATRNVRLGFGLIFLSLLIFVIAFSWTSWQAERQDESNELSLLAELSGKSINSYFAHFETNLTMLSQEVLDADGTLNLERARLLLKRFKENNPEIANANIADISGQVLASAVSTPGAALPDLSQHSTFILGREALLEGQVFNIGRPTFGQIVKEWTIPFRYGVRDRKGKLRYILNAPIPLAKQQSFWQNLSLPENAQMGLLRDDLYLLSIYPLPKTADIQETYGRIRTGALAVLLRQQKFPQRGLAEGYNTVARANYNFAFYRLPNYPITFFVTTPISNLQAKWWKHNQPFYLLTIIFLLSGFAVYYRTAKRQARVEIETQQQEEKFRSIYEGSNDAIMLLTGQGFFDCNQHTLELFGLTNKGEFISSHLSDLSPPLQPDGKDSVSAVNEHIRTALKQGSNHFEWIHRRKNGEDFPADVTLTAFPYEGKKVLQATVRDITDRMEALEALKRSEAWFRSIFENTNTCIASTDGSGRVTSFNEAFRALLGYDAETLKRMNFADFTHPDDLKLEVVFFNEILARKRNRYNITKRYINRDGRVVWVDLSAGVIRNAGGDVTNFVAVIRDITEHKRAEEQVRRANESLEQRIAERTSELEHAKDEAEHANRAKSEFLARMSHELRTPMNAILGFSQVLEVEPLNAEQQGFVHEIHQAGDHLLELINDLLDISRIESGRMEINIEAVGLGPITEPAIQIIRPLLQQMNLTLIDQCAQDVMVLADATRLKQILVNLLSNAAKYNRGGGRILIECQPVGAERLRITVSDTGAGISQENIARLFTPFERLGMSENSTIEGTGIGLALSKKLAQLMDGDIGVESTPGQGSTFWIELPLLSSALDVVTPTQPQIESREKFMDSAKILYVEDNIANLKVVEGMLRHQPNVTLLSATNGEYGLELAQRYLPEVILLDIHLPDMDGFAVLKALQSNPATRNIPVIAVSADAMPLDVKRGLDAGFCRYLTKPIKASELIETVSHFLVPDNR